MLPAETAEMRKGLLTLALAKPRKRTKAILKKKKKSCSLKETNLALLIHFVNIS